MRLTLPYGTRNFTAEIDWGRCLGILDIAETPAPADVSDAVRQAIENPIGLDRNIYQLVRPGETVAILVSDSFRKTRIEQALPILLDGLTNAGIADSNVRFVFATGSHRPPTPAEQSEILGADVYARFADHLSVHDPRDETNLADLGATSRGTPVRLNKRVCECDRIIATGTVVMHYFAGFGGGRKAILPGISGLDTISHNHAMNLDPHEDRIDPSVRIGALDGNPVAEDMLEGARLANADYVINTVLDREGEIAGVFAGELDAAHRAAADFARSLYAVPIPEQADLVVASSGATPNFVQSHKALVNAYEAVKQDGRIILLAECREGLGGEQFAQWLDLGDKHAVMAELRKQSEINGQTALSTLQKAPITTMVTAIDPLKAARLGVRRAESLEHALDLVRSELPLESTFYVMPAAAYTVPIVHR